MPLEYNNIKMLPLPLKTKSDEQGSQSGELTKHCTNHNKGLSKLVPRCLKKVATNRFSQNDRLTNKMIWTQKTKGEVGVTELGGGELNVL